MNPLKKKKKLILITLRPGLFVTVLSNQIGFLSNYYKIILISGTEIGMDIFEKNKNIEVHRIHMARGISVFWDLISLMKFFIFCRNNKPDIIHSFTPKGGLVGMVGSRLCSVPVRIHTFTGLVFPSKKGVLKNILLFVDRLIMACSTHCLAESETIKHELEIEGAEKNINIIGNGNIAGVDTEFYSRMAVGFSNLSKISNENETDCFRFVFIGRINRDKGIHELVKAFLSVEKQTNRNLKLLIAGSFDEIQRIDISIKNTIENNESIFYLGQLSSNEVREALFLSNVFVLPSFREGFSNAILQAASMSLPCIATKVSGNLELIEHKVDGWLVDVGNQMQLEIAMLEAIGMESSELCDLGERLRQKVITRYCYKTYNKQILEYYRKHSSPMV